MIGQEDSMPEGRRESPNGSGAGSGRELRPMLLLAGPVVLAELGWMGFFNVKG